MPPGPDQHRATAQRRFMLGVLCLGVLAAVVAAAFASARPAQARQASNCANTSVGLTAITDLGRGSYKGTQGGLYPGGANTPPAAYLQQGVSAARQVRQLNGAGSPAPNGRIALLSIGMSNASFEFGSFEALVRASKVVNPSLVTVNGATPGATADVIDNPRDSYWSGVDDSLSAKGVTSDQVEVVWLYDAIKDEDRPYPQDADALQQDLDSIISILTQRFPNLQLIYLSSREYAGYATIPLNPEPFAYDSGFAVKSVVAERVNGRVAGPWVGWGPYTWADGLDARSDGLRWACSDFEADGTHPSGSGRQKVANLLLNFFESDPTAVGWFLGAGSQRG